MATQTLISRSNLQSSNLVPSQPQLDEMARVIERMIESRVGAEQAINRGKILQLVRLLPRFQNASDRHVRAAVEDLRERGVLLCNLADGTGYYLAATEEEYRTFRALYCSHAYTMLARVKRMDEAAAQKWGAGVLQDRLF